MLPAQDQENYQGAIFVNPGGPGASGTQLVEVFGKTFQTVVGPQFAILGFDPRGTGASTPLAQCFDSDAQYRIWLNQDGPALLNATADAVPLARSREQMIGDRCLERIGGNGKEELDGTAEEWGPGRFMTTPSVTTDMVRIMEKLGQEKMLYWGFSYGSILGQYFAAMYPDKVGRVAIDGIADGHLYRAIKSLTDLEDAEEAVESFFSFCNQAGPQKCKLYSESVADIRKRVFGILDQLDSAPIPVPFGAEGPFVFTRKSMQSILFQYTYAPIKLASVVSDFLLATEARNQTALGQLDFTGYTHGYRCDCSKEPLPWVAENQALYAIWCSDGERLADKPGEFDTYLRDLTAISPFAGPLWAVHYLKCAGWKIEPKWRYTGPLSAENTSHPLLVVSTKVDPVCPLSDALRVRERYGGAGLLQQNSVGHCSLSSPSLCSAKHIRAYFANGSLPEEGTVCEVDELPFVGKVEQSLAAALTADDAILLEASRHLSTAQFGLGSW